MLLMVVISYGKHVGVNTTSAIIGHVKGNVLYKLSSKCPARNCISVIQDPGASVAAVSEAGQQLMVLLYGGTLTDTQSFALFTLLQATAGSSVSG